MQYIWYVLGALSVAGVSFGIAQNFRSVAGGLVTDGDMTRLAVCPGSPNCVSSYSGSGYAALEPWRYGTADRAVAHDVLLAVLGDVARVHIVLDAGDYVHAVFRSRLFRFRDDVEFYLPENEALIHFRAASRVGQGDLGVHERRMRALARTFQTRLEARTD